MHIETTPERVAKHARGDEDGQQLRSTDVHSVGFDQRNLVCYYYYRDMLIMIE
jgi:hypothetical protein